MFPIGSQRISNIHLRNDIVPNTKQAMSLDFDYRLESNSDKHI